MADSIVNRAATAVEIGTAKAAPGETVRGVIPVTALAGGSAVEIPLVIINGRKPGPVLWVDGAIHGDEPEGPLCCQILMREVKAEDLSGTLVLVPVVNVAAYEAASRGNPLDTFSHDMNRMMADVESLVRNNPGPALAAAAFVGFLVGRAMSNND